jgi:hypothetical protein
MSRGFFIAAVLAAVIIVVGLYLFGSLSSPPEVVRTSGPGDQSQSSPPPVPAPAPPSGPVDPSETGGAQNTGGGEPPPQ